MHSIAFAEVAHLRGARGAKRFRRRPFILVRKSRSLSGVRGNPIEAILRANETHCMRCLNANSFISDQNAFAPPDLICPDWRGTHEAVDDYAGAFTPTADEITYRCEGCRIELKRVTKLDER